MTRQEQKRPRLQQTRTAVHAVARRLVRAHARQSHGRALILVKLPRLLLHLVLLSHCVHLNGCCELLYIGLKASNTR